MNINSGFAIGFFSIFGAVLVVNHVSNICRKYWPPTSRWMVRHVFLPRLFLGRHTINPTRVEILCHLLHWTAAIVYNTWDVDSLGRAALRAGQLAVIHVVPLLITYQLGFVSNILGLSLTFVGKVHQSLAVMALVQGTLHSVIYLQTGERQTKSMLFQIMVPVHSIFGEHIRLTLNRLQDLCSHCPFYQ